MKYILLPAFLLAGASALAQAPACNTCHGAKGEGNPQTGAPRIAGQSEAYILRQLEAYANGMRNHRVMSPIAKQFSEDQRRAAAKEYSAMETPSAKSTAAAPAAGRTLATVGDAKRQLQACANCHGPDGIGEPPGVPYLAGLNAAYLVAALQEWKTGARKSDPSGQMPLIGKRLGDDEIKAVAQYYASLTSPSPKALIAKGPARATDTTSRGPGETGAVQGIGVEQGVPTTGGGQGPGGGGAASGSGSQGSK